MPEYIQVLFRLHIFIHIKSYNIILERLKWEWLNIPNEEVPRGEQREWTR